MVANRPNRSKHLHQTGVWMGNSQCVAFLLRAESGAIHIPMGLLRRIVTDSQSDTYHFFF
jgi:hypothetical protein